MAFNILVVRRGRIECESPACERTADILPISSE